MKIHIQKDGCHLVFWEKGEKFQLPKNIEKEIPKHSKFVFAQKEYEDYNDLIDNVESGKQFHDLHYTDKYGRNMFLATHRITLSSKSFLDGKPGFSLFLACAWEGKLYYLYANDVDKHIFVVEDADCISEEILYESLMYKDMCSFLFGDECEVIHGIGFEVDGDED